MKFWFGRGGRPRSVGGMEELARDLKRLMGRHPRRSLAVAESLTAGHVQARIAAVSGASKYFRGGVTAYTLDSKVKLLGVDRAHARRADCVSERVAVEMALGAAEIFAADLAVATTGYAEPNKARGVRHPLAWWAICHRMRGGATIMAGQVELPGAKRVEAQQRVAEEVLRQLVDYLRREK
jgi:nicotinamide-nucleotide amidase